MNITELVKYFKFGYSGETIDLIYLIIIFSLLYKLFCYVWKRIKKGGVFSAD